MSSLFAYSVTLVCLLGTIGHVTGVTPQEELDTAEARANNLNFYNITELRNKTWITPSLIYDSKLETGGNSAEFVVEEISKKFKENKSNQKFWQVVTTYWEEKEKEFVKSLWSDEDIRVEENVKAAQYLLHVFSPKTLRVFIKNEVTFNGGLTKRNKHKVVTYFSPPMPMATMDAAVAFKYIDALHLLNSYRQSLRAPPLALNPEMCEKANLLLEKVENQAIATWDTLRGQGLANKAAIGSSITPITQIPDTAYFGGNVESKKDYSVFMYRIPAGYDLTELLYKFPYAALKQIIFEAYADSFTTDKYAEDPEFYEQIKNEISKLLEPSVTQIGLAFKISTHKQQRYAILYAYFGENLNCKMTNQGSKDLKFDTVFEDCKRKDTIRKYLATLPTLNLRAKLMRYG